MKKRILISVIGLIAALAIAIPTVLYFRGDFGRFSPKGQSYAEKRTQAMADAANADQPEAVYDYLCEELRSICTRETFAANWEHERTYPYLIPYWVFFRSVELDENLVSGTARFERAARLPGQYEEYGIVYENGGYYFDAFRKIADGSYIEIFERLE